MDRKQLKEKLTSFYNKFANEYPIENICLTNEWIGIDATTYVLMIIAPKLPDKDYYTALERSVDIYWNNTTSTIRKHIRKIYIERDVCCELLRGGNIKKEIVCCPY